MINRWSTDAERDQLLTMLHDKGQGVGYINTPGSLRYELHFASQRTEAEGDRMVFLMTDRYVGSWEAMNRPRTIDYPFTLLQLQVDKSQRSPRPRTARSSWRTSRTSR